MAEQKYEYRIFCESETVMAMDDISRFASIRDDVADIGTALAGKLAAVEPGDWEAVSHDVVLLDRMMVITVLARRPK